jgi:dTDP-4-dehydrorhamnose 3,5-epimerase
MTLAVEETSIPGVQLITPVVHGDARGFFFEAWRADRYAALGLPPFVQDNVSRSSRGVLRGLHVQHPHPQGKLIQALEGEIFDVAVDVRVGSPTFGQWTGHRLSSENHSQLYVPPGVAHGFCVLSDSALITYKCTDLYHPETELTIAWDDPTIAVAWPIDGPMLSGRDAAGRRLSDLGERLPGWRA